MDRQHKHDKSMDRKGREKKVKTAKKDVQQKKKRCAKKTRQIDNADTQPSEVHSVKTDRVKMDRKRNHDNSMDGKGREKKMKTAKKNVQQKKKLCAKKTWQIDNADTQPSEVGSVKTDRVKVGQKRKHDDSVDRKGREKKMKTAKKNVQQKKKRCAKKTRQIDNADTQPSELGSVKTDRVKNDKMRKHNVNTKPSTSNAENDEAILEKAKYQRKGDAKKRNKRKKSADTDGLPVQSESLNTGPKSSSNIETTVENISYEQTSYTRTTTYKK